MKKISLIPTRFGYRDGDIARFTKNSNDATVKTISRCHLRESMLERLAEMSTIALLDGILRLLLGSRLTTDQEKTTYTCVGCPLRDICTIRTHALLGYAMLRANVFFVISSPLGLTQLVQNAPKGILWSNVKTKHFQPIHYASKNYDRGSSHVTHNGKRITLPVLYAFEKFRPYLVLVQKHSVYGPYRLSQVPSLLSRMQSQDYFGEFFCSKNLMSIIRDIKEQQNLLPPTTFLDLKNPIKRSYEKKEITETFPTRDTWDGYLSCDEFPVFAKFLQTNMRKGPKAKTRASCRINLMAGSLGLRYQLTKHPSCALRTSLYMKGMSSTVEVKAIKHTGALQAYKPLISNRGGSQKSSLNELNEIRDHGLLKTL
ncbi:hypothetical protein Tco_0382314 [Tanacetum coccineum]